MSYFDKFIKDLEDRRQRKKDSKTILEQEQQYQERRRERVRRFQERWQNTVVWKPVNKK
jgi:hypothetical protein|tara:strand:+ start:5371 stop:5547 length:177 start_codon:yes stop_codon:yes gene_type:complete